MRILITADPELPVPPVLYGGIERIIELLIEGLRRRGHAIALTANADSTVEIESLFPWSGKSSLNWRDSCLNALALQAAVRRFEPDLVHSFSRLLYLLPILPRRLPKIMTYEREPTLRTVRQAVRLARGTLSFTGCSDYICRVGRKGGGNWSSVHNSVDVRRYRFQPSVSPEAPLVFLSRVERIKGAHTAIAIAKRAGRPLMIAGNHGEHGEEKAYWEQEIMPHVGHDGIQYLGPVNDAQKNELLGRAAAMLVPIEWNEPFGIVFAESLACGTPVISCPRGALPEIIRNDVEGYLVNTVEEAVSAIGRLNRIDRGACRRRAEEAFSAEWMVDRYETLYQSLVRTVP
jgi:glycosyltransferase involved in cell wall biosynthesis